MLEHEIIGQMRTAIDLELRECVTTHFGALPMEFKSMVEYQMGWENGTSTSPGKRLRPLILLSACHALGVDWQLALPAAAAIELVHNFSLVHDDIQDRSETRRGKPTIWVKWGEAQAINLGDTILTLANLTLLNLPYAAEKVLDCTRSMQNAIFSLTQGQYLDLANESIENISIEDYWNMVAGKTGALFSTCLEIAARLAGNTIEKPQKYADLGLQLGRVFQVQDDYLGIWGNDLLTGKSTESDISSRKKTFPIIFALENLPEFREVWFTRKQFSPGDVAHLKRILDHNDIHQVTKMEANQLYQEFMKNYEVLFGNTENKSILQSILQDLLGREI